MLRRDPIGYITQRLRDAGIPFARNGTSFGLTVGAGEGAWSDERIRFSAYRWRGMLVVEGMHTEERRLFGQVDAAADWLIAAMVPYRAASPALAG